MNAYPRQIAKGLQQYLQEFPAVAILGPRQVGKTTLAMEWVQRADPGAPTLYLDLDLESPSDLGRLSDPEAFFAAHADHLLVLDEMQRMPGLFMVLRGTIDRQRRAGAGHGRFLLLGSASIDLLAQSAESLAGRLAHVELAPFVVTELPAEQAATPGALWLRGGFPQSYLARSDAASLRWRQQFITTYLERDIPSSGRVSRP